MTQRILAFSGKKQSGKNTACNYVVGRVMKQLGVVQNKCSMTDRGELWVSDIMGDSEEGGGVFDLSRKDGAMFQFLENNIHPYVKIYSFADLLKENVCMAILGLSYEQCYGTDEQKNTLTHLKWEDMPCVVSPKLYKQIADYYIEGTDEIKECFSLIIHKPGPMTSREVMQYVGTDIFRKMWGPVWADATMKTIRQENTLFALICDCRFENEVDAVNDAGGKVMRFRGSFGAIEKDGHESEGLGEDYGGFAKTVDVAGMSVSEQCYEVKHFCEEFGFLPKIEEGKNGA